jgi:thiamine pyrophosphate-dependent acetolactate synthase large subunit-like protein
MTKIYEALAEAFKAEGVDTQFALMGDGNMHWSTAFAAVPGVQTIHVRHEHCTVAAATAYNAATGKIAAASVTCGPGLTQLMTALPAAARARLPLVVFAGEAPINAKFYNQYIDQAPLVTATGAHYIAAHSVPRMMDYVREAFHVAKYERRPVVLGIPYDLQKVEHTANQPYETSEMYFPKVGRIHPDPALVAEVVDRLAAAKRPMIIGGRGVQLAGAREAVMRLADRSGALLANTLPMRGLFYDHEFCVGIPGSYFTALGKEMFESADLVLAIGTSLSYYVGGGHYFVKACKIQVDDAPRGLRDGQKAADIYLKADALVGAEAIIAGLDKKLGAGKPTAASIRSKELANRIATEPADAMPFEIEPGLLDPRDAIRALDAAIPKDWDIVGGTGHQAFWLAQMRGRSSDRFTTIREFGAVGNGLSYAMGVAAARRQGREGKLVLIEGDGGFLFHIQELETIKRHGLRMLICVMNDAGYGSEFHKLRADGVDDSQAIFGRPKFEEIGKGFGLRGREIKAGDLPNVGKYFAEFAAQSESEVWNIQISDKVTAPIIRATIKRGHGKM